jgi:cytochrome c peroxidase
LLGRSLFYDPLLSADRATACVTCHSELWGLGDQLPRSVGIDGRGAIGPGRTGPHMTRRNAPALWNLAQRDAYFWDGRAATLEAQVFFPLENPDELARDPDALIADLDANASYVALFREAFPEEAEPVTRETLARALATFMRAYVSDHAPYDQFLAGDLLALDAQDQRGWRLFNELGCQDCHVPPRFESDRYADRSVPNPEGIADEGRFEISADESERGAFRVPTLRNARETSPYFHNGAVRDFDAAIQHEVDQQIQLGLRAPLSSAEFSDLSKFLRRALTDTSREQYPPPTLPSGLSLPLDGDRLLRGGT